MKSFIASHLSQKTQKAFINAHLGEKCVILGGGQTLKFLDLKYFENQTVLGVNLLPFHRDYKLLDVKYNIITQPRFFAPYFLRKENDKSFIQSSNLYKSLCRDMETKHIVYWLSKVFNPHIKNWFPVTHEVWDPEGYISNNEMFGGAFYSVLNFARLAGFQDIIMVGFDSFTLAKYRNRRWYEAGLGDEISVRDEKSVRFISFLCSSGMKISTIGINTSSVSKHIEYIDGKSIRGLVSGYQENSELLLPSAYKALQSGLTLKIK